MRKLHPAIAIIAFFIAAASFTNSANAALIMLFEQNGPDLTVTASGSVDLTGLTPSDPVGGTQSRVIGDIFNDVVWSNMDPGDDKYTVPVSYELFGSNFGNYPGSATGDGFGIYYEDFSGDTFLYFDAGFSGGAINGQLTIPGLSLASLGLQEGVASWGASPDQAAIFTTVSVTAVPEPTCLTLLGLGGLLIAFLPLPKKSGFPR